MKHKNKSKQKTGAKKQIFQSKFHLQTIMFSLTLAAKKSMIHTTGLHTQTRTWSLSQAKESCIRYPYFQSPNKLENIVPF